MKPNQTKLTTSMKQSILKLSIRQVHVSLRGYKKLSALKILFPFCRNKIIYIIEAFPTFWNKKHQPKIYNFVELVNITVIYSTSSKRNILLTYLPLRENKKHLINISLFAKIKCIVGTHSTSSKRKHDHGFLRINKAQS